MAKSPDFNSLVPKLDKQVNDFVTMINKHAAQQKKKYTEFETIRAGLVEGKKAIAETRKQLESEEATFEKMSKRINPITSELLAMSKEANDLGKELEGVGAEVEKAEKDLTRAGGQVEDLKSLAATLKKLKKTVADGLEKANELAREGSSLPDVPKL